MFLYRRSKNDSKLHIFVFKRLNNKKMVNTTDNDTKLITDSYKLIIENEKREAEECFTEKGGKCINILLNRFDAFDKCKYCKTKIKK